MQVYKRVINIQGTKTCFSSMTLNVTAGYPWQQLETSWISRKEKCKGDQGPMLPVSLITHFHVCIIKWFLGFLAFLVWNPWGWWHPVLLLFSMQGWVSFLGTGGPGSPCSGWSQALLPLLSRRLLSLPCHKSASLQHQCLMLAIRIK